MHAFHRVQLSELFPGQPLYIQGRKEGFDIGAANIFKATKTIKKYLFITMPHFGRTSF